MLPAMKYKEKQAHCGIPTSLLSETATPNGAQGT